MTMQVAPRQLRSFNASFTVVDGDSSYDTSAEVAALVEAGSAAGNFSLIWEKTVPAQQVIYWGYGDPNQQRNQSFNWFAAIDAGTGFEDGILRLTVANATRTNSVVVAEFNTANMHTVTATSLTTAQPTSIDSKVPLPLQTAIAAGEDSYVQLFFKSQSVTTTVDQANFSLGYTVVQ
jgi:hypothetical protein